MLRVQLPDAPDPLALHAALARNHEHTFILESKTQSGDFDRYTLVGFDPIGIIEVYADRIGVNGQLPPPLRGESHLDYLRKIRSFYAIDDATSPFVGGLVGLVAFDYFGEIEATIGAGESCLMRLGVYLDGVVYDRLLGETHYVSRGPSRLKELENLTFESPRKLAIGKFSEANSKDEFLAKIIDCKEKIFAGEIFQVVLSRQLRAPYHGDPSSLYQWLRENSPVPYLYHIRQGDVQALGASPEMLVRVRNGTIETFPIAGTRRLKSDGKDPERIIGLLDDRKEAAEHAMLVDLARNDVAKVSIPGTTCISTLREVRKFRDIVHIVSKVESIMAPEMDALDVLRSCFPAGTVSGAPKIRAVEIIRKLEPPRGLYAGAVFYWSFNGDFDSAIAIRSAFFDGETVQIQAGAGIVKDSIPELEYLEIENKLATIRAGLGVA